MCSICQEIKEIESEIQEYYESKDIETGIDTLFELHDLEQEYENSFPEWFQIYRNYMNLEIKDEIVRSCININRDFISWRLKTKGECVIDFEESRTEA
jgi:hypothetical protein